MKGEEEAEEEKKTRNEIQQTFKRLKKHSHTERGRERVRAIKCEIVWPKMTHKANIAAYTILLHMVLLCHIFFRLLA